MDLCSSACASCWLRLGTCWQLSNLLLADSVGQKQCASSSLEAGLLEACKLTLKKRTPWGSLSSRKSGKPCLTRMRDTCSLLKI